METKTYISETAYDSYFFISLLATIVNVVLLIAIVYFIIKLYKKLMKFLDKNS